MTVFAAAEQVRREKRADTGVNTRIDPARDSGGQKSGTTTRHSEERGFEPRSVGGFEHAPGPGARSVGVEKAES